MSREGLNIDCAVGAGGFRIGGVVARPAGPGARPSVRPRDCKACCLVSRAFERAAGALLGPTSTPAPASPIPGARAARSLLLHLARRRLSPRDSCRRRRRPRGVPSLVSLSSTPRGYGFLLFSLTDLSTHLSISPPCRLSPATRSLAVTVRRTYSSPNLPTPRPPGEPPCSPTRPCCFVALHRWRSHS